MDTERVVLLINPRIISEILCCWQNHKMMLTNSVVSNYVNWTEISPEGVKAYSWVDNIVYILTFFVARCLPTSSKHIFLKVGLFIYPYHQCTS